MPRFEDEEKPSGVATRARTAQEGVDCLEGETNMHVLL